MADACIKVSLKRVKDLPYSNRAILIHTEGKIKVYNNFYEELETFDESANTTFYLIEKLGDSTDLYILNDNHSLVVIETINVYHPHLNPFLDSNEDGFM